MALILLVLLLALILGGLGFAIHILWWIALIVLVVWLLGFLLRVGEGGSRSRWYRWLQAAAGLPVGGPHPAPISGSVPGSGWAAGSGCVVAGWAAASASSTLSYSGSRSARPVIHSALVYR
jgi:hypothetical protein